MRRLLVLSLMLVGCASGSVMQQQSSRRVAVLTVSNDWRETITVYIAHSGARQRRLGTVEMKASAAFLIADADLTGDALQVVVVDRLSGFEVYSDVVPSSLQNFRLDFGPLPGQVFLYPKR